MALVEATGRSSSVSAIISSKAIALDRLAGGGSNPRAEVAGECVANVASGSYFVEAESGFDVEEGAGLPAEASKGGPRHARQCTFQP